MIRLALPAAAKPASAVLQTEGGWRYLLHGGPDPVNGYLRTALVWETRRLRSLVWLNLWWWTWVPTWANTVWSNIPQTNGSRSPSIPTAVCR